MLKTKNQSSSLLLLLCFLPFIHSQDDLFSWISNLRSFKDHDRLKSQELQDLIGHLQSTMTEKYGHDAKEATRWIKDQYFRLYSQSYQNTCAVLKKFGGIWVDHLHLPDGVKHICFDKVFQDLKRDECLVYSFGLSDDWSFEEEMLQIGCKVRAFDPTVEDENGLHDGNHFKFAQIGITDTTGAAQIESIKEKRRVMTLSDSMKYMGDEGKHLTILKVDIEGMEFRCFHDWIESGILNHIDQIHLEIHNSDHWFDEGGGAEVFFKMVGFLWRLH